MKSLKYYLQVFWGLVFFMPLLAFAVDTANFAVGDQGYDLVSYFTDKKPVKGNGDHVVMQNGINYLFASDEHKKMFQANPEKYLPQFGGWCAMGVALGKKVGGDPLVWKIIDGKLYLNLNERVSQIWTKNLSANIQKANTNWPNIKDIDPSKL